MTASIGIALCDHNGVILIAKDQFGSDDQGSGAMNGAMNGSEHALVGLGCKDEQRATPAIATYLTRFDAGRTSIF